MKTSKNAGSLIVMSCQFELHLPLFNKVMKCFLSFIIILQRMSFNCCAILKEFQECKNNFSPLIEAIIWYHAGYLVSSKLCKD